MIDIKMYSIEYEGFITKYQNDKLKKQEVLTDLDSKEILSRLEKYKDEDKFIDISNLYEHNTNEDRIIVNPLTIKSCDDKIFKIVPVVRNDDTYKRIELVSDDSQQCLYYLSVDHFLHLFTYVDLNMLLSNVAFVISTAASIITIINFFKEIIEKKSSESKKENKSKSEYSKFTLKIWNADTMYEIKCNNSTIDEIRKLLDILKWLA